MTLNVTSNQCQEHVIYANSKGFKQAINVNSMLFMLIARDLNKQSMSITCMLFMLIARDLNKQSMSIACFLC